MTSGKSGSLTAGTSDASVSLGKSAAWIKIMNNGSVDLYISPNNAEDAEQRTIVKGGKEDHIPLGGSSEFHYAAAASCAFDYSVINK